MPNQIPLHLTATGILNIGDPHVSGKRIGRRKDDYRGSVLNKLEECATVCALEDLVAVIPGDLFHKSDENDLKTLNRLFSVLKQFPSPPLVLEGNHDRELLHELSDGDALKLVESAGLVRTFSEGAAAFVDTPTGVIRIWGCAHGLEIPTALPPFDGTTILVTHHDMAFGSPYPGALPMHAIENCQMVINGHMHKTLPSVVIGGTCWHNPGNIEPLSVDVADHLPQAWSWRPGDSATELTGHPLSHGSDLFDLTGLQVAAADSLESVQALGLKSSSFADMLETQEDTGPNRTEDATLLLEDLDLVLGGAAVSEATQQLLQALAAEVSLDSMSS